ncbi:1-aminocyclopropane-1-carboxylate deaminase/D-cysteine desulfhydrase [Alkalimarinus coralli]|uniref:1-aminocyclopropane-1-carboxylate deaminase/D-cysteine desulfhydrase n=1 Tax=Alkalimarinus coralli TaxID=2935863 RepID=UPI00202B6463|nr:pyridoxal-phosphate dependent enzyme [Alkalimarinus coralli]
MSERIIHAEGVSWLLEPPAIPLEKLEHDLLDSSGVELWVARLDLVDPLISGNKWFKLKYNLIQACEQDASHIVSFGGAFSNHLHALAAACYRLKLKSTGVLRGEIVLPLNPTLSECQAWGMNFYPVTRAQYREKTSPEFIQRLRDRFGQFYLAPEGGSNVLAVKGMSEVALDVHGKLDRCDYLCCAVGSGGTLAGLVAGSSASTKCIGYSALKGANYLKHDIDALINQYQSLSGEVSLPDYSIDHSYHFGGFAKVKEELLTFIEWFEGQFDIPLEQIYTAKMFYGIFDQIKAGYFKNGQRVVAVHTGGLQGRRGIERALGSRQ